MVKTRVARLAVSFALLAVAAVVASQKSPEPLPNLPDDFRTDQFQKFPGPNSRFDQSDLVLIGIIQTVKSLGPPRQASANREVRIEPFKIAVRVENAIIGQPPSFVIEVYGYLYSWFNYRQLGQPHPFQPEPGQRRLLFLRLEGTRLRLLHDVFDYSLRVFSGERPRIDQDFASSPRMAAAWILLARGQNCLSEWFAVKLVDYTWFAYEFVGAPTMMQLLGALADDPSPRVRTEAFELRRSFDADIKEGHEPFGGPRN
jgi:hypothetical protein